MSIMGRIRFHNNRCGIVCASWHGLCHGLCGTDCVRAVARVMPTTRWHNLCLVNAGTNCAVFPGLQILDGGLPVQHYLPIAAAAWNALPKLNNPLIRRGQAVSTKAMKKLSFALVKPPYPSSKARREPTKRIRVPSIQGSKNAKTRLIYHKMCQFVPSL